MYKIYLNTNLKGSNSIKQKMLLKKVCEQVELELLKTKEFVIYKAKDNMDMYDIKNDCKEANPYVYIALGYDEESQGIKIYTKLNCEISQGISKEIYKCVQNIYYDKNIDNGVVYDKGVSEKISMECSSVYIALGNLYSSEDMYWLENNANKIAYEIKEGIVKGINLRPC